MHAPSGGDLDNWLFNIDALSERSTVVALDLPGHGQSDRTLPGRTLGELARFVIRFLDAVEIRSAHLVGHSLGGTIAAQMAPDHPDRVESLAAHRQRGAGAMRSTPATPRDSSRRSHREI